MAYTLQAVIADGEALRAVARDLPAARLASIGQDLSLMPMTDVLFDSVADGSGVGALGFRRFPGGFERDLAAWSAGGPVAYVEAEYFGGAGEQRAAVWDGGTVVLGPLHVEEGQPFPPAGSPISQALRRLGAVAAAGQDEFSAVGLGRHRHGAAWIA
ncbi:hypothetical protein [Streptomyces chromofuscus]|uniref:Uncharacterized protein n=1 Tax=Streptomyces chromofuscus TaxID=42881 RepID=A0A7M2T779_STRCW|nr:hypothetical protein [Streptomyces chromofuscus]QOV44567.1 hypothetical protein IPT68_00510 [Streptomyces chromofuscus]GGT02195.1 hypothetical protein GCM10010254_23280 [Streptomyces chromofuscus]